MKNKKIGYVLVAVGIIFMSLAFLVSSFYETNNSNDSKDDTNTSVNDGENKNYITKDSNGEVSLETESSEDVTFGDISNVKVFDYEKIEEEISNNNFYYSYNCNNKSKLKELDNSSLKKVINKLKSCNRYSSSGDKFTCLKHSYVIGDKELNNKIFEMSYMGDSNSLFVKYNNESYVFFFEDSVSGFIESL